MSDQIVHVILDNSVGFIRQTEFEERVRRHPAFSRLNHVYQNSAAYLTWPTIRNQRFEHSLGTKHLAGKFFFNAVQNTDSKTLRDFYGHFMSEMQQLIKQAPKEFINSCNAMAVKFKQQFEAAIKSDCADTLAGYYDFLVPSNVPNEFRMVHCVLIQSIRLAGMLHDVGHPPFSHVCEAALKDAYVVVDKAKSDGTQLNSMAENLHEAIQGLLGGRDISSIAIHEAIGVELARTLLCDICKKVDNSDLKTLYMAESLVAMAILSKEKSFEDLRQIISGTVDVDRMDYVKRDSINSGIGSDIQYDRIIDGVKIVSSSRTLNGKTEKEFIFAFPTKALDTIELFLRKRYENYRTIIYHHNVVKSGVLMRAVVSKLVERVLKSGAEPNEDLAMPRDISGLWHPLVASRGGSEDALLAYSQWNDAWLISVLDDEYTRLRVEGKNKSEEDMLLEHQLGELLFSEKHYRPLIKRKVDCKSFRNEFDALLRKDEKLDETLGKYKEAAPENHEVEEGAIASDQVLEEFKVLVKGFSDPDLNAVREFAQEFKMITTAIRSNTSDDEEPVYQDLEEAIADFVSSFLETYRLNGQQVECKNVLVGRNAISAGTDHVVFFYDSKSKNPQGKDLEKLSDISRLPRILQEEIADMPAFFIYLYIDQEPLEPKLREDIARDLAKRLSAFMSESILEASAFIVDQEGMASE